MKSSQRLSRVSGPLLCGFNMPVERLIARIKKCLMHLVEEQKPKFVTETSLEDCARHTQCFASNSARLNTSQLVSRPRMLRSRPRTVTVLFVPLAGCRMDDVAGMKCWRTGR